MIKRICISVIIGTAIVPLMGLIFAGILTTIILNTAFVEGWWDAMKLLVTSNPFSEAGSNVRAWLLSIVLIGVMVFFSQRGD